MQDQYARTRLMLGSGAVDGLRKKHVAVFGIGGVGGFAVEALVRCGVGELTLVDDDRVCLTNLNRQLYALRSTIGKYKAELAAERCREIDPSAAVHVRKTFFLPENAGEFDFGDYDYVIDAVDTVTAKLAIIQAAREAGTPVISAMGAGNKLHPEAFRIADLYQTRVDPLARVMRRECKKRGITSLKVAYSEEKPMPAREDEENCFTACVCPPGTTRSCSVRRDLPGSISFVPPVVGFLIAGEVVRDLTGADNR